MCLCTHGLAFLNANWPTENKKMVEQKNILARPENLTQTAC
jgi:hypothetical protein